MVKKDEIQSPEQKGCPLGMLAFLGLMILAGLAGFKGAEFLVNL